MRIRFQSWVAAFSVACGVLPCAAAPLFVNNSSFESPGALGNFIGLVADGWTINGPGPAASFGNESSPTGDVIVYYDSNPGTQGFPTGVTGKQAVSIFPIDHDPANPTGPSTPASISQALVTDTVSNTPVTFQSGKVYKITLDLALAGSAPPPSGVLKIALGYVDGGGVEHDVATRLVQNDPASLTGANRADNGSPVNQNNYLAFSATSPLLGAGDAAVGKQISVLISGTGPGGGEFNLDNVRVDAVPEPASLGTVAAAGGIMLLRRRKRHAPR